MTETVEAVVIGAGVVGLACARALAQAGREVVVLEAAATFGTGVSSRNSEVIHAGIYYPTGSLKAELCVAGNRALYEYCAEHGVAHRRCGKLIVATDVAQVAVLEALAATARANGVDDLAWLDPGGIAVREPQVRGVRALFSPRSGIVDSHGLMLALLGDVEAAGGALACGAPVLGGAVADGLVLEVGGTAPMRLGARVVVNAAGLEAVALARRLDGVPPATIPTAHLAKGSYFALSGVAAPFRHLVYPVPEPGGLGVHATIDLGGQTRFGPDVEWVAAPDYAVDPARAERFYAAIRAYWPGLPDGALRADYAGLRPKIVGPGAAAADFAIQGPGVHGVAGLVTLYGIESPGLTAALAIGARVAAMV